MTRTEVPFISSNDTVEHDNNVTVMEIVHTLSMHIPRTKTFHLQLFDLPSVSDTIKTLKNCLPGFLGLVYLWIEIRTASLWATAPLNVDDTQAEGLMTVRDFGDACGTLAACCLDSRACRKVDGTW
ncbi:hypothetical protein FB451DRAFT_1367360, partial [Mycena latifolia]